MADRAGVMKAAVPGAVVRGLSGMKRFVSFPFSDVCGPVADGTDELLHISEAMATGNGLADRGWARAELRTRLGQEPAGFSAYQGYTSHVLKLGGPVDNIFSSFHKDCVQRKIRKAFRAGLDVYEGSSLEDVRKFYGLHLATRRKLGAPVQPFSFFRNLWNTLRPEGLISVLLVKSGEKTVSGVVLLKYAGTVTYKFGASDENYLNLGTNQLALWTAIRKAADEGFQEFDFGRSFTGRSGLADFKARWGAKEVQLNYLYSPARNIGLKDEGGACAALASTLFKSMPSFSNRLIGRLFYKYLA